MRFGQYRVVVIKMGNTIVDEWATVEAPPPPELIPVAVNPVETVFLVLDIQNQNCNPQRRLRCVNTLPKIQGLLAEARSKGISIIYSLTRGANPSDIRQEVAPIEGEAFVKSGVDKFFGTELERILKAKDIKTLILVGTSAHGAVLHTATGATLRGFQVIVPVDCISADGPYTEQYTIWHLANAPGSRKQLTLTRADLIRM